MYDLTVITKNKINSLEEQVEIDLREDTIIAVPDDTDIVSFKPDGRIEIHPERPVNCSFAKVMSGFIPVLRTVQVKIPMKLYIPFGYQPELKIPRNCIWMDRILTKSDSSIGEVFFKEYKVNFKPITISCSEHPDYVVHTNFSVTCIVNTELMQKENPGMLISKDDILCELSILKDLRNYFGNGKIYYIQNSEIYYKLMDNINE